MTRKNWLLHIKQKISPRKKSKPIYSMWRRQDTRNNQQGIYGLYTPQIQERKKTLVGSTNI